MRTVNEVREDILNLQSELEGIINTGEAENRENWHLRSREKDDIIIMVKERQFLWRDDACD